MCFVAVFDAFNANLHYLKRFFGVILMLNIIKYNQVLTTW